MSKDRLGQEERDEPVFPKPRMKLSDGLILGPNPLNRVRLLPRMIIHWPRWNWPLGLTAGKGWWWGEVAFSRWYLNLPLWRAQDKDTERPRQDRHLEQTWLNQRETSSHAYSILWHIWRQASSDGSGDSSLDDSTGREIEWIQLNFIIPFKKFDLIICLTNWSSL